jgi:ribose/xylose/arabinose/galactoside ABC-type transport system permease subunit
MNSNIAYILFAIVVLYIIAVVILRFSKVKNVQKISPIGGLAFAFVLAGLVLGQNRVVAYSLLGIGVALAIVDIVLRARKA